MASLLSPRRTVAQLSLRATVSSEERATTAAEVTDHPVISWPLAAVGGALASAFFGWVLVVGVTVLGWLAADPGTLLGALRVGTQLWLLANGAGAKLGAIAVTVVPWGATAVFAYMMSRFAAFAARQTRGQPATAVVGVTAVMTLTYLGPVLATALLLADPARALRGGITVLVVMAAAAGWGSSRALNYDPFDSWPVWARSVPRAVFGAQLAVVAAGAGLLVVSLLTHRDRVMALTAGLDPGVTGGMALVVAQLALVPNAVIFAASYALGAGFTLGHGSVVAVAGTDLGVLPGIPLLGAVPQPGPGSPHQLWWLAAGVVAGAVAAWIVVNRRPAARCDETSLVGGLSGVVAALGVVVLAWISGGDLGTARLTAIGPRLLPMLVMAATTMGLAGMITGLGLGLLRHQPR